jgi:uncharacterized membrane protein YfcA
MNESATTLVFLIAVVFGAAFEQTISGFGFSLIVMPLATLLLCLQTAAPLVALAGLTLYTINLIRFHQAINTDEVLRLGVMAAIGVPVGIWGLVNLNESIVKIALGSVLIVYALYNLARPALSHPLSQHWVYLTGFLTGCFGGAYNTPGPPLLVYGSLRQWHRDEFRAVLQALFFLTGTLTVFSHLVTQHLTANVLTLYGYAAPALLCGIGCGSLLDRRINKEAFRVIVTAMIFVLGWSLVIGGR